MVFDLSQVWNDLCTRNDGISPSTMLQLKIQSQLPHSLTVLLFIFGEFSNGLSELQQSHREFWQVIGHAYEGLYLLFTSWFSHLSNCRHFTLGKLASICVYVSPKKSTSVFLYCSLSKFSFTLHFLAVSSRVVNATSWSLWFCFLPTIIMSSAMTITWSIFPNHQSSLCWKTSPATVLLMLLRGMKLHQFRRFSLRQNWN